MAALEDVYQPFRPKRRTRATIAREKGLEPLAELLWQQDPAVDPQREAAKFVTPAGSTVADELQGARRRRGAAGRAGHHRRAGERRRRRARAKIRELFLTQGVIRSEVHRARRRRARSSRTTSTGPSRSRRAPSHRVLAIRRGAAEGVLLFQIRPPEEDAVAHPRSAVRHGHAARPREQVRLAVQDLLQAAARARRWRPRRGWSPRSAPTRPRSTSSPQNLRATAARRRRSGRSACSAIDPGFRTGCKIVVLDAQGQLLHNDVIYPDQGQQRDARGGARRSSTSSRSTRSRPSPSATAPASRETEAFVRKLGLPASVAGRDGQRERRVDLLRLARSRARSSPTTTSPCAARSRSAGG